MDGWYIDDEIFVNFPTVQQQPVAAVPQPVAAVPPPLSYLEQAALFGPLFGQPVVANQPPVGDVKHPVKKQIKACRPPVQVSKKVPAVSNVGLLLRGITSQASNIHEFRDFLDKARPSTSNQGCRGRRIQPKQMEMETEGPETNALGGGRVSEDSGLYSDMPSEVEVSDDEPDTIPVKAADDELEMIFKKPVPRAPRRPRRLANLIRPYSPQLLVDRTKTFRSMRELIEFSRSPMSPQCALNVMTAKSLVIVVQKKYLKFILDNCADITVTRKFSWKEVGEFVAEIRLVLAGTTVSPAGRKNFLRTDLHDVEAICSLIRDLEISSFHNIRCTGQFVPKNVNFIIGQFECDELELETQTPGFNFADLIRGDFKLTVLDFEKYNSGVNFSPLLMGNVEINRLQVTVETLSNMLRHWRNGEFDHLQKLRISGNTNRIPKNELFEHFPDVDPNLTTDTSYWTIENRQGQKARVHVLEHLRLFEFEVTV